MATLSGGDITRTASAVGAGPPQNYDEGDCEFILYRYLPKLVKLLDIDSLRVFLRAEEFLSDDDMEMLNPQRPDYVGSKIVEQLVKLVRKKGQKGLEKFFSALRKSTSEDNQPGHEELLQLFENEKKGSSSTTQSVEVKEAGDDQVEQIDLEECHDEPHALDIQGCSSTTQSTEVNAPLKEAGDDDPESNDRVEQIDLEDFHDEPNSPDLQGPLEDPEADVRPEGRQKCGRGECCISVVSACITTIFCLGLGIPQLTIGSMGAAAPTDDRSYYCGKLVFPFHLCVGGFLTSCGLLICVFSVWKAVKELFSNGHRCVDYTIAVIAAVFAVVLLPCSTVSFFGGILLYFFTAIDVFRTFSAISIYHCNYDALVMYYWAFAEIVIPLSLIGLVISVLIIVGIVALFSVIVSCLTED